jgi:hypothetical protein
MHGCLAVPLFVPKQLLIRPLADRYSVSGAILLSTQVHRASCLNVIVDETSA